MVKLNFSVQAVPINAAISEGRIEDARTMVIDLLVAGKADRHVQRIAAELLRPKKRGRGRRKELPKFWMEIGEEFAQRRDGGAKYEDTLIELTKKYGFSETHIRTAVATYQSAQNRYD